MRCASGRRSVDAAGLVAHESPAGEFDVRLELRTTEPLPDVLHRVQAAGYAAVWGTLRLIRTRTFTPFVVYRVIVGVGVVLIAASSFR